MDPSGQPTTPETPSPDGAPGADGKILSQNPDTQKPAEGQADPAVAAREAARAAVPADAAGYALTIPDSLKPFVAAETTDPAWQALVKHAAENKWPQGRVDDAVELLDAFQKADLLEPVFDPAAETAKLGDNGKAQQQEQETFLTSLKARGDIGDEEFGELMSLVPTAAGTRALAALRKIMGSAGTVVAPGAGGGVGSGGDGGQPGDTPEQAEARRMARDERYDKDPEYRKQADAAFMRAFTR